MPESLHYFGMQDNKTKKDEKSELIILIASLRWRKDDKLRGGDDRYCEVTIASLTDG